MQASDTLPLVKSNLKHISYNLKIAAASITLCIAMRYIGISYFGLRDFISGRLYIGLGCSDRH